MADSAFWRALRPDLASRPGEEVEIDLAEVGRCLLDMVHASITLGHRRVTSSVRDYVRGPLHPEGELVRDVLLLSNEEILQRWPSFANPVDLDL